jgi:hypothetical protein
MMKIGRSARERFDCGIALRPDISQYFLHEPSFVIQISPQNGLYLPCELPLPPFPTLCSDDIHTAQSRTNCALCCRLPIGIVNRVGRMLNATHGAMGNRRCLSGHINTANRRQLSDRLPNWAFPLVGSRPSQISRVTSGAGNS